MGDRSDKVSRKAQAFLWTGAIDGVDLSALATACDQLIRLEVQKSTTAGIKLAATFVKKAASRGKTLKCQAYRTQGWTFVVGGRYLDAERSYLKAREMVARDALSRGRIDRILIDIYMYLGDYTEAQRRARMALNTFKRLDSEGDAAKTRVNFANLLHRRDRHRQARKMYEQAAAYFEKLSDDFAVAVCHYNLANTLVQLFEFEEAERLYADARRRFDNGGFKIYATDCLNGTSWLHMLRGDYHIALQELSESEKNYREASQPRGVVLCLLDRAETYLGLNLFEDARDAAAEAEKRAGRMSIQYEKAKAAFFQAKALLALGRRASARVALQRAEGGFTAGENTAFLAASQLLASQIDPDTADNPAVINSARERFARAQLPLWEAVCDLEQVAIRPEDDRPLRRLAQNPAVRTVPHLFARRQTLLGDRQAARGRTDSAVKHWSRAADMLDTVRAKLPPVDLRTGFSRHRSDPYLKLISTESSRDPATAAAWSERYKTAGLWATAADILQAGPQRQRAADSLAALAQQVTALSGLMGDAQGKRTGITAYGGNSLTSLQRTVRHDLAAVERHRQPGVERLEAVRSAITNASRRETIVQFHFDNDDLLAFVHEQGRTRCHRYPMGAETIGEYLGRWRFLLARSAYSDRSLSRTSLSDETRLFAGIGDWLWSPLELSAKNRRLLILPEGKICNLPWNAIHYGGQALVDGHQLTVSPSLRHHLRARERHIRSRRTQAFVGSIEGLEHAREEIEQLSSTAPNGLEVFDPCNRGDIPESGSVRLWHYTGHAQLRCDNPFYSSLMMNDGPLFAADFRLKSTRVDLVMLAGCRTGQQAGIPGEESTGLVRSLLEMGARNVIASHWAIADRSAAHWMRKFYEYYFGSLSVAEAARQASIDVREKYRSAYHWAAFSLYGAG